MNKRIQLIKEQTIKILRTIQAKKKLIRFAVLLRNKLIRLAVLLRDKLIQLAVLLRDKLIQLLKKLIQFLTSIEFKKILMGLLTRFMIQLSIILGIIKDFIDSKFQF